MGALANLSPPPLLPSLVLTPLWPFPKLFWLGSDSWGLPHWKQIFLGHPLAGWVGAWGAGACGGGRDHSVLTKAGCSFVSWAGTCLDSLISL